MRDLSEEHGFDSESADGRPRLPLVGGGAHFLTFRLGEAGVVATLRTSGTEPKIKWVGGWLLKKICFELYFAPSWLLFALVLYLVNLFFFSMVFRRDIDNVHLNWVLA